MGCRRHYLRPPQATGARSGPARRILATDSTDFHGYFVLFLISDLGLSVYPCESVKIRGGEVQSAAASNVAVARPAGRRKAVRSISKASRLAPMACSSQPRTAPMRNAASRLHDSDQQAPRATGTRRSSTSPKVTANSLR